MASIPYTIDRTVFQRGTNIVVSTTQYSGNLTKDTSPVPNRKEGVHGGKPDNTGWRAPTRYLRVKTVVKDWRGPVTTWTRFSTTDQRDIQDPVQSNVEDFDKTLPTVSSGCIARAEIGCLTKIKDRKVELALTVLEMREAVRMVESRLVQLYTAYNAVRRHKYAKAAEILGISKVPKNSKRPAKAWLEMQLGWVPLANDIYGYVKLWQEGFRPEGLRLHAVRDVREDYPKYYERSFPTGTAIKQYYSQTGNLGCRVRLDYTLTNSMLSTAVGLGITNPAHVAWQMVPMSFIVDWGLPIGDWLNILDADYGLQFKGGSRTIYAKFTRKGTISHSKSGRVGITHALLTGQMDYVLVDRTTYSKTPIPVPTYVKLNLTTGKGVTALALARQRL